LRPLGTPDDPETLRRVFHPRKGPEYLVRTMLLPYIGDMYADLATAAQGADFLISGEVVLAASLVAEKLGLPWAGAILAPFSFFSIYDPPPIPFLPARLSIARGSPFIQRQFLRLGRIMIRSWNEPLNELRRSLQLRAHPDAILTDRFSPFLNLALFSGQLGRPQQDWPANTVQTGFVLYDPPGAAPREPLDEFLSSGPPPITFTLGSAAVMDPGRFFEESAAAVRQLGTRGLLLMGKNALFTGLPKELFAAEYAPYSSVFPRSACVVHQGGVGTTAQAMRAGVPQLIMPYGFDQPDNAARMVRLGVGLSTGRNSYRASAVARQLQTLGTRSFQQRAREVGNRVSTERGVLQACEAVERVLYSG